MYVFVSSILFLSLSLSCAPIQKRQPLSFLPQPQQQLPPFRLHFTEMPGVCGRIAAWLASQVLLCLSMYGHNGCASRIPWSTDVYCSFVYDGWNSEC